MVSKLSFPQACPVSMTATQAGPDACWRTTVEEPGGGQPSLSGSVQNQYTSFMHLDPRPTRCRHMRHRTRPDLSINHHSYPQHHLVPSQLSSTL